MKTFCEVADSDHNKIVYRLKEGKIKIKIFIVFDLSLEHEMQFGFRKTKNMRLKRRERGLTNERSWVRILAK
jgi:hypothetical protein